MTFRKRIRKNKFSKNGFHNLQGTVSHRPLTNASSLKITAAYYTDPAVHCTLYVHGGLLRGGMLMIRTIEQLSAG